MDITSPFFVVPVMAIIFLSCTLFAGLTGREKAHEGFPDVGNLLRQRLIVLVQHTKSFPLLVFWCPHNRMSYE